ncbi:MAG: metalloregulator ArsR/SmtB family transcription factor [Candidatus Bathyarchaeota archaeon]|nr:metalloregulator ArsR/SmtB family transcription factor [Candidatus Bathyarchaeota archaeon]
MNSTERLRALLESHFCDMDNTEEHEKQLREAANQYFQPIELTPMTHRFKALSDMNRLKILRLLTFREMCVCELTAAIGLTQPNLSHHIKKLEAVGLVKRRRDGKWVYYSIADPAQLEKMGLL